jgi:hypothetical protein
MTLDLPTPDAIPTTTVVEAGRLIDYLALHADADQAVMNLTYLAGLANQALHHAQGRQAEAWRAQKGNA